MAVLMADAVLANYRRRNRGGLLVYLGEMPGTSDEQRAIDLRTLDRHPGAASD
jgi:hypothetical protein